MPFSNVSAVWLFACDISFYYQFDWICLNCTLKLRKSKFTCTTSENENFKQLKKEKKKWKRLTFAVPCSCRTSPLCRCSREKCVTPFWWFILLSSSFQTHKTGESSRSSRVLNRSHDVLRSLSFVARWLIIISLARFPLCLSIQFCCFHLKQSTHSYK